MRTWFTADLHLGHRRIIELCKRPFADVAEMNGAIAQRWNELVRPNDTVWMLGDIAMGDISETLAVVKTLHGRKHLIAGNHDKCFHGYKHDRNGDQFRLSTPKQLAAWVERYKEEGGFISVNTGAQLINRPARRKPVHVQIPLLGGPAYGYPLAQLSHFPYSGESRAGYEDRYKAYRPTREPGRSPYLIHGHVHDRWCVEGTQVNVGVDVWNYEPVPADIVASLLVDQ